MSKVTKFDIIMHLILIVPLASFATYQIVDFLYKGITLSMLVIFCVLGGVSALYFRGFMRPVFVATITSPALYVALLSFKDGVLDPLFFVAYFYLWNVSFPAALLSVASVKLIKKGTQKNKKNDT